MNSIGDAFWPGTRKVFVDVKLTLEETGRLIESREKNGEESVEKMETASTADGPGQGKK